jgi:hypothetical protein
VDLAGLFNYGGLAVKRSHGYLVAVMGAALVALASGWGLVQGSPGSSPSRAWGSCGSTDIVISYTLATAHGPADNVTFTYANDLLQVFGPGDGSYAQIDFILSRTVKISGPHANLTLATYDWGWKEEGLIFDDDTQLVVSNGMDFPPEAEGKVVKGVYFHFATYGPLDYAGGPHGYIGYGSAGNVWSQIGLIDLGGDIQCGTTGPVATAWPQMDLPCITATVATSATTQPTTTPMGPTPTSGGPTPTRTPTRTPGPSPTPGGPTPTPPTGGGGYDSGLIKFAAGLEGGLSAVGRVNSGEWPKYFLAWSPEAGPDGAAGVAMFHAGMGDVITATNEITDTFIGIFKTGGYIGPVGVTFQARTAYTQTEGTSAHSIRVWYLDPDYDGQGTGVWITTGLAGSGVNLSNIWRKFGAVVTASGGSGQISAIGFTDEIYDPGGDPLPPCPTGSGGPQYGCVYLDDLHITYGSANALQFPTCGGGGAGSSGATHVCVINQHTIDVMGAHCPLPTSFLDIGGYVSWLGCSLKTYFTILPENSAQINAVTAYANQLEPFGTVRETGDGLGYVQANVSEFSTRYTYYNRNPTTDWGRFFNWASIEGFRFPAFTGVDPLSLDYSNCNFAAINNDVPLSILRPACLVERFAIDSGLLAPLNLLVGLFCAAAVFMYVRNNWMVGMSGGEE